MAALQNHGDEIARYFSMKARGVVSYRTDGAILVNRGEGWKVYGRKKAEVTPERWREAIDAKLAKLKPWKLKVKACPSIRTLMKWSDDGICMTPTGHRVEPDGYGPDGVPSWLRILGMI